jgi:hypothetical protein
MYSIKSEPTCAASHVSEHEMISKKEENTSVVTIEKAEYEVNNYVYLHLCGFKSLCRIMCDCILPSILNCLPT